MISSAAEFVQLRTSEDREEYGRAANDPASLQVWLEVVRTHPELKVWVAHNKTIQIEILELLSTDPDSEVRVSVAAKRKLRPNCSYDWLSMEANWLGTDWCIIPNCRPTS